MTTTKSGGDMQFVAPLAITLAIDGCDVTVTPLVLRDLPRFTELMVPIMASTPELQAGMAQRFVDGKISDDDVSKIITALAVSGEQLIDLVVLCTKAHSEPAIEPSLNELRTGVDHATWVGGLLLDRALTLAAVSLQVNIDFFSRAMPQIRALASRLRPAPSSSDTPTPSSSS
ncbi:MAG: hypothetical protein ABL916_17560 [Burkholderiaceae bacterium]